MPSRTDIDPVEIPRLLPICLLADVDLPHPRIRLLGTNATNAYGSETRGWPIDRFQLGEFTPAWIEAFEIAMEAPVAAAGSFVTGAQFSLVEAILMPLSYDGKAVSHIFGGLLINPSQRSNLTVPQPAVTYVTAIRYDAQQTASNCRGKRSG